MFHTTTTTAVASSSGHSQILSHSCGGKIRRMPGNIATSQTGNGELGYYEPSPHHILTESAISSP